MGIKSEISTHVWHHLWGAPNKGSYLETTIRPESSTHSVETVQNFMGQGQAKGAHIQVLGNIAGKMGIPN